MKLALSTMWWWREGEGSTLDELAHRTRALGFAQVELDYRRLPHELAPLRQALAAAGISVASMHAPFPCPPGDAPLRQADLANVDPLARRHAEALVAGTLEEAARWGAAVVVLHGGDIAELSLLEGRLKGLYPQADGREFARRQRELRRRRAQEAPRRLEWLHQALSRLAPRAQALGVRIALENRASYRDLPAPGEMAALLDEFWPAVGAWYDVGHAFRLEALGFYPQERWLTSLGTRLLGLHLHDVSGLTDHLPPGQGEVPFDLLAPLWPRQAHHVLEIRAGHSDEAITAGLDYLRTMGVLS